MWRCISALDGECGQAALPSRWQGGYVLLGGLLFNNKPLSGRGQLLTAVCFCLPACLPATRSSPV